MDLLPALLPVLLGLAPAALPRSPELSHLQETLRHTRSLSARFTQTKRLQALEDTLVTTGRIEYRRGGRLVWHTDPPGESDLVLEGTTATLRLPGAGTQAFDLGSEPGMARVFETLRAVLEADLDRLAPLFSVQIARPRPLALALSPRTPALGQVLRELRLEFDAQDRLLHVTLREPDGDRTDIAFRDHVLETSRD